MAHHANTPKSVLDAPARTVTAMATPQGATRRERRHGYMPPADLKGAIELAAYSMRLGASKNTPVVRATARRGRKVRRGGAL